MKKFIIFSLILLSMQLAAQDDGATGYLPVQTPVWSEPLDPNNTENRFISYDMSAQEEQTITLTPGGNLQQATSSEPFLNGQPDDDPESRVSTDNFNYCEYIENTGSYHFSTYVKLFITFGDGSSGVASGTMIGRCVVITAAHCIFDKNKGGQARSIEVVPGYNNNNRPFGTYYGRYIYYWSQWSENRNYDWDMGMIQLTGSVGDRTGTLGYGYDPDNSFFQNHTFHNMGYPADNPFNGEKLYYCYGTYDQVTNDILYYNRPNYGGNSGGATYYKDNAGQRYVYAVHSHTINGKSGQTRITQPKYQYIYQIVHETCPVAGGSNDQESTNLPGFTLSPNPASSLVNITFAQPAEEGLIRICDLTGLEIRQMALPHGEKHMQFDVNPLRNGLYFIYIESGERRLARPFIKMSR
jgi:V8-like Glu-specific endopeptidase